VASVGAVAGASAVFSPVPVRGRYKEPCWFDAISTAANEAPIHNSGWRRRIERAQASLCRPSARPTVATTAARLSNPSAPRKHRHLSRAGRHTRTSIAPIDAPVGDRDGAKGPT